PVRAPVLFGGPPGGRPAIARTGVIRRSNPLGDATMAMETHEGPPAGMIARPTGMGKFETALSVRDFTIVADEPEGGGGGGRARPPLGLLSPRRAAAPPFTTPLSPPRKGWDLPGFRVEVAHKVV